MVHTSHFTAVELGVDGVAPSSVSDMRFTANGTVGMTLPLFPEPQTLLTRGIWLQVAVVTYLIRPFLGVIPRADSRGISRGIRHGTSHRAC